jgi:glycosyltransferase involved in cell wall biosynthesis
VSRLLFLTESFHPILGGGERHIRLLSTALAGAGLPSTVLTRRSTPDLASEEHVDGVRVLRVPPSGPGRTGKYLMVPHVLTALARERDRFDILVIRGTRVLGLPGLVAARALRKQVVLQPELNGELSGEVYTFGTALDQPGPRRAVRIASGLRNRFFVDADAVVAMSSAIRQECLAAGCLPERVALIPHGVSTHHFRPADKMERDSLRRALGLPEDALIIVSSGRLLRGKGLEVLVEAFSRFAPREPQAHLLFVGSGEGQAISVEASLRESVRRLGLVSRVTFAGRQENVADYLRASDLFAFPSVFEALGIALIEAQACGLPAVGSRTGGIVDVIEDSVTGILVPPGDADALEAALLRLVRDHPQREAFGARARTRAKALFSDEESLMRYRALFQELSGPIRTSRT